MPDLIIIDMIKKELFDAKRSQASGNQGRARVCARRAAGWAIQEHLRRQGSPAPTTIALELIKHFATLEGHPPQIYKVLHHLTVRMAKDSFEEEAYYPIKGVDLVAEANWLVQELLGIDIPLSE